MFQIAGTALRGRAWLAHLTMAVFKDTAVSVMSSYGKRSQICGNYAQTLFNA
jgi:hypothetical protein